MGNEKYCNTRLHASRRMQALSKWNRAWIANALEICNGVEGQWGAQKNYTSTER